MSIHKSLNLYVGHEEGGCSDVAEISLNGFSLLSDDSFVKLHNSHMRLESVLPQRDKLLKFAQSIKDFAEKYPHDAGIYDHVKYELSILDFEL